MACALANYLMQAESPDERRSKRKSHMSEPNARSREGAYELENGSEHRRFYDDWAPSYDIEFARAEGYVYPEAVAARFLESANPGDDPVADIGCGTGLLGEALSGSPHAVDGFDISPGMLRQTARKRVYGKLEELDLLDRESRPIASYGGLVSCGTFTIGHLGPAGMENSLALARPGALCVFGINARHFEAAGFKEFFCSLYREGRATEAEFDTVQIYSSERALSDSVNLAKIAVFRISV